MLIHIKQGSLRGREDTSIVNGSPFFSFLGIPYGKPPIGELRFQPPVPADGWEGVRDATYDRDRCFGVLDPESMAHKTTESEDCLYLNVFTPKPPNADAPLKPVMVHIHGGGYHFGTGNMDGVSPDHLAKYDVVLVSMNYRLHILGYLNLKSPCSPGNCGSKDQVLALRWINENIRSFGGDPDNVTIYGASSGGNAVHLLTLSPLAEGLFHKAIIESGTIIGPWIRENQIDVGFKIGEKLGFTGTSKEELVEFLQKQPAEVLVQEAGILIAAQKEAQPCAVSGTQIFVPSIEHYSDDAFLPDYPENLISKSRPIPILAGVAEKEGITVLFGLDDFERLFTHLKTNFEDLVKFNVPCDPNDVPIITQKIKEFYKLDGSLDDDVSTQEFRERIVEIYSHLYFMNLYVVLEASTKCVTPFYVYQFAHVGELNVSEQWHMNVSGALHADELEYVTLARGFYPDGIHVNTTDRDVVDNLCTAWTNFARTSDPNPLPDKSALWSPCRMTDSSYMQFTEKCTPIKGEIWAAGLQFWNHIFTTYVDLNDVKNRRVLL